MSNIVTTTQDTFRGRCIDAYCGVGRIASRMVERARENRGQTAAEYMGVLLVVSVIIAAVATTDVGSTIKTHLTELVDSIFKGEKGGGGGATT